MRRDQHYRERDITGRRLTSRLCPNQHRCLYGASFQGGCLWVEELGWGRRSMIMMGSRSTSRDRGGFWRNYMGFWRSPKSALPKPEARNRPILSWLAAQGSCMGSEIMHSPSQYLSIQSFSLHPLMAFQNSPLLLSHHARCPPQRCITPSHSLLKSAR